MRKLKEVLRLHSLGLSQHQIARSCCISQSTVHEYVSAAQATGARQGSSARSHLPQSGARRAFRNQSSRMPLIAAIT